MQEGRYKIGEIAQILGVSSDSLRYYETLGIVTPKRDQYSGYRYYDAWDLNKLLGILWWRSYGFSLADVVNILYNYDMDSFEAECRRQELNLLKQISEAEGMLKCLVSQRQKVTQIRSRIGTLTEVDSPTLVWKRFRTNDIMEHSLEAEKIRQWTEKLPYVQHTFILPKGSSEKGEFNDYCWGFSVTPETAEKISLDLSTCTEVLPSYKSIYAVFSCGERGTFIDAFNQQVIQPMKEAGYEPVRPPFGNLLITVQEEGVLQRYFEVWVPIE